MPRCDLEVHSCFSDKPTEWVLRKLGMPESYTQPKDLYWKLKGRGFDFITITDHNTIQGCLSIADMPGVFLSEEVTTYFPNDECKIHLLVWDLNEKHHSEISKLRTNIFDLSSYLREQNIPHGVAHPLYSINKRLTVEHFEKLVLLFRVFGGLNGTREPLAQSVATLCLKSLTKEKIDDLANRHNLPPTHDQPWLKSIIGGSDDHGGLYMGHAWTEVDHASSPREFLQKVMEGNCSARGSSGDAMRVSTSVYHTAFMYARDRLGKTAPRGMTLLTKIAERFLAGQNPTDIPLSDKISHIAEAIKSGRALDLISPSEVSLDGVLSRYFLDPRIKSQLDKIIAEEADPERRTFRMASKIVNDVSFRLFRQFMEKINKGEFIDSLQPLTGMLPLWASLAPYFFSFHNLHGNRAFLGDVTKRFTGSIPQEFLNERRAWFTDTLEDVNGVARTIRAMCKSAHKAGHHVIVVTSRSSIEINDIPIMNFAPVGEFEIPEYKLQKLSFPPILEMIDYIEREKFTECIISTPGPVGLTALCAAKILGLRTSGIYHTDFPQYVRILTEDDVLETLMWSFMHWFYSQLDLVYVNSSYYKTCWVDRGIAAEKIEVLPRGLDTELFNPRHRDAGYWKMKGAKGKVLLYVGRVSKEKELGFLAEVYKLLKARGENCSLAIVGDGPYKEELAQIIPDAVFTGILTGQELGTAYASADLFVFPSTTDTFGNVVIEALSSGLPVMVSDIGGPCELITHEHEGRVLPANNLDVWCEAISQFIKNPITRDQSLLRASIVHSERSWDEAFENFWSRGLAS